MFVCLFVFEALIYRFLFSPTYQNYYYLCEKMLIWKTEVLFVKEQGAVTVESKLWNEE